jgi:hypothetical protein
MDPDPDPDPAIFVIDLPRRQQKTNEKKFCLILFKGIFSKIQNLKEVTKQ